MICFFTEMLFLKFLISTPSHQEVRDYPNRQEDLEDPEKQRK